MNRLLSLSLVAAAFVAGGFAAACGGKTEAPGDDTTQNGDAPDADEGTQPTAEAGTETMFQVLPSSVYSGHDGVHDFQLPVAVYGGKAPTLTASDGAVVTVVPTKLEKPGADTGVWFMITVKKAGNVTLTAKEGAKSATSALTIAEYDPASWATGNQRYTTSGGAPGTQACTNCHVNGQAIDHSPATMASATDKQVETVIRTGVLVAGSRVQGTDHRWTVTDEQAKGLVTFLRALPPRGFVTP